MRTENGIVADGEGRHLKALQKRESKEVGEFQKLLEAEEIPARRAQIEQEIREVRQRYQQLRRESSYSLF